MHGVSNRGNSDYSSYNQAPVKHGKLEGHDATTNLSGKIKRIALITAAVASLVLGGIGAAAAAVLLSPISATVIGAAGLIGFVVFGTLGITGSVSYTPQEEEKNYQTTDELNVKSYRAPQVGSGQTSTAAIRAGQRGKFGSNE